MLDGENIGVLIKHSLAWWIVISKAVKTHCLINTKLKCLITAIEHYSFGRVCILLWQRIFTWNVNSLHWLDNAKKNFDFDLSKLCLLWTKAHFISSRKLLNECKKVVIIIVTLGTRTFCKSSDLIWSWFNFLFNRMKLSTCWMKQPR